MGFLASAAVVLSLPLVLAGFTWYAVRARRSGGGPSLMTPFEELWDPASHRQNIEIRIEAERTPQAPSPGDPPLLPGTRTVTGPEPGHQWPALASRHVRIRS